MSKTIELTKELISRQSVTPEDCGCQAIMAEHLSQAGFINETLQIEEVTNLWSLRGQGSPLFVFAGHTDVVPVGDVSKWNSHPFDPVVDGDVLTGRGAADMKGSLAAMVVAVERFVAKHPEHKGTIAFLITSDEEGDAHHGTKAVMDILSDRGIKIDWALVGEPSSTERVGDVIKNGRRGSMLGRLVIHGIQGHVAYPHLAKNPVHMVAPVLAELSTEVWDEGNDYFPATSFQVSNFNSGTGASNVIPGTAEVQFSFRFSTEVTPEQLQSRVRDILDRHALEYELTFDLKGEPFLTDKGALVAAAVQAIKQVNGEEPVLSTAGGTSDGRFIAPTGAQVLELGPVNRTIHQINECVSVRDLDLLTDMYEQILINLLA
ncbi:succinyl-diaminopimelate desuccinylase [Gynuella sunshinyii]|uniref:Succinyl-diaminopimelate desuccinylase n=1 Tax=Gynuella sunshinyii YC6258 TaxID=1445510 RepID=A0A0C5VQC0_9GAMM|nr:succinyl-diaminopimelate desuccinylase [Gynuella sunshinyii]AJQ96752.1 acetylornithine deacetylase/Succinyl-diaminopimelate desuccinylase and related deacylase [Gynuella sunshinyii YC6258]